MGRAATALHRAHSGPTFATAAAVIAFALSLWGGGQDAANAQAYCPLLRTPAEEALPAKCPGGRLLFEAAAGFTPRVLPRAGRVPIGFHLASRVYDQGDHPPPLRELILNLDRHVAVDTAGFSTCVTSLVRSSVSRARRLCADTIVGRGSARIEIAEPEGGVPLTIVDAFTVYKVLTNENLAGLMFQFGPVMRTSGLPIAIARSLRVQRGRFGTNVAIDLPEIAAGDGSIVALDFTLRRQARAGEMLGILRADCPDRHLDFRTTAVFVDGTRASERSVRACSPAA